MSWCSSRPWPTAGSRPHAKGWAGSISRSRARPPTPEWHPQDGRSAIVELAHQILRAPGAARPGGRDHDQRRRDPGRHDRQRRARARVGRDRRAGGLAGRRNADRRRLSRRSAPVTAGRTAHRDGSFNRPPMERTPAIASLFEQARRIGRRARPGADRGIDRRRQRRQLHRGAGHPDPRRPGRRAAAAPTPTTSTS